VGEGARSEVDERYIAVGKSERKRRREDRCERWRLREEERERSEGGLDGTCRFANIQRGARRLRSSIRSLVPIILSN